MASDYFRFYRDGLTEPRLVYAIQQMHEVVSVWLWVLCECCRTKSDRFDAPSSAMLVGVGSQLNIGPGKVAAGLDLLVEIEYLAKDGEKYVVRAWNRMQSEYLRDEKTRRSGKLRQVTGNYGKLREPTASHGKLREKSYRRGEESIGEETKQSTHSPARPDDAFERIWQKYPIKAGKPKAHDAYRKAVRSGTTPEQIEAGLDQYLAFVESRRNRDFPDLKHRNGDTWFRNRGWEDEYTITESAGEAYEFAGDRKARLEREAKMAEDPESGGQVVNG